MITKPKKKKPLSYYRNKADRLFQEIGRKLYKECMICGGEYSCLHHYWPKATSTALRYDLENAVPICCGDHLKHHTGNPRPHETVVLIRGKEWADRLDQKRKEAIGQQYSRAWYEQKAEELEEILSKLG